MSFKQRWFWFHFIDAGTYILSVPLRQFIWSPGKEEVRDEGGGTEIMILTLLSVARSDDIPPTFLPHLHFRLSFDVTVLRFVFLRTTCFRFCRATFLFFRSQSYITLHCTGNSKKNISRNETARPHSQYLHSCICEDLYILTIVPQTQYSKIGRPCVGIYSVIRSQIQDCRN